MNWLIHLWGWLRMLEIHRASSEEMNIMCWLEPQGQS